jgi:redox-sensitive bicupin YhaK (pirin superfamily)
MADVVTRVLEGRPRDLGGFSVRRVLPAAGMQTIGPFIFFDHMGPAVFQPGSGVDVRPHPHIGLATVTYLFDGAFMHRDSLGTAQVIRPGDVNWMVAGRGIVHSERTPQEERKVPGGASIHGIQTWIALPKSHEEIEPSFAHHPSRTLPEILQRGCALRLIAGEAFGQRAPASVYSRIFYLDARLEAGATAPVPADHIERAAYVASGEIEVDGTRYGTGQMLAFARATEVSVVAPVASRIMLFGGDPVDAPRHIWWNFVSSSQERIERAKLDWRDERFAPVPGETERIPLPDG